MTIVKRAIATGVRKLNSLTAKTGTRELHSAPVPDLTPAEMQQILSPDSTDVENRSRRLANAGSQTGFTCVRCLTWFPQGTHHACQKYEDVIRGTETPAPATRGGMTPEELQLLKDAGQL